jgi:hypothetical protein
MPKKCEALKFNNKAKLLPHRLPFFNGKERGSCGANFWSVPERGGYSGGNETGESLALIYFNYLKNKEVKDSRVGILQNIALDMLGGDKLKMDDSRRGQIVGFFSEIEKILTLSTEFISATKSDDDLLEIANKGLDGYNRAIEKFNKQNGGESEQ